MGLRFSLQHANWVASLLEGEEGNSSFDLDEYDRAFVLEKFFEQLKHGFKSTPRRELQFDDLIDSAELQEPSGREAAISKLRHWFAAVPWKGLLLPSSESWELTSHSLLEELVAYEQFTSGLLLQLQEPPTRAGEPLVLASAFPALKVALKNYTRWPGILVWTDSDAVFIPLPGDCEELREQLKWIVSMLSKGSSPREVHAEHRLKFQDSAPSYPRLQLLHLSDLHLGHRTSALRLPRAKDLVTELASQLQQGGTRVVPVVTGDVMDSPNGACLDAARSFLRFLRDVVGEKPIVVLGNHDVRRGGVLDANYREALGIDQERIRWFDESKVGVLGFNSVRGGRLARGSLGERELADMGGLLDNDGRAQEYSLVGLLHHHPVPVDRPNWYRRYWYEVLLGGQFNKTDALEDADLFLEWADRRGLAALLHGHRHIPRVVVHNRMLVVGCGSTLGHVNHVERGRTHMSLNVLTIDHGARRYSSRLFAETIPGAGMEPAMSGELFLLHELPQRKPRVDQSVLEAPTDLGGSASSTIEGGS